MCHLCKFVHMLVDFSNVPLLYKPCTNYSTRYTNHVQSITCFVDFMLRLCDYQVLNVSVLYLLDIFKRFMLLFSCLSPQPFAHVALQNSDGNFRKWDVVTVSHINDDIHSESKRLRPRMLWGCFPQERKWLRLPTPLFLLAQNLSSKWTVPLTLLGLHFWHSR